MAQTSVSELFSKCHARIGRAVHHSNETAEIWNGLDIMRLLAVTLFVKDDGTGTLDVNQVEPLPENLELELGEFLYQLRAALDGAVYASAIQDSGQNPPPKTSSIEFPICERKEEWAKQSRKIALLNVGRQRFIEVTQPFAEPPLEASLLVLNSNRCLRFLNELARIDRHRRLHTLIAGISIDRPLFELPEGTRLEKLEVRPMSSMEGPAARFSLSGWQRGMKLFANPLADIDLWLDGLTAPCHPNDTLPHRLQAITMNVRMIVSFLEKNEWLPPSP
ncbi:hypothetical protein [Edaphobacter albus]|uniref:hypothetical protein n=1 Tax=Edaphobacter sp. 4G125 TaxID=2763071 RepID=UPI00164798A5|nr:hypothetical protein [Edaphobacter sp. 4G125]QNI37699.1 hypothetical protein H7846_05260 [Edaphobacter sp. 4G125]